MPCPNVLKFLINARDYVLDSKEWNQVEREGLQEINLGLVQNTMN